jgi:hypothetical protein
MVLSRIILPFVSLLDLVAMIGPESWYAVAGGEAGYIEADPTNADITYGGGTMAN